MFQGKVTGGLGSGRIIIVRKEFGLCSTGKTQASHLSPMTKPLMKPLAYGWIDSLVRKIDDKRFARKFTPHRPWSIWSKLNIKKVRELTQEGRMTQWGLAAFVKRMSEISFLEKLNAEEVKIPMDLEASLRENKEAWENFEKFAPSYRKRYLVWISGAKSVETRAKRIEESVMLISKNVKTLLK